MTMIMAIQIILTLAVTAACTFLAASYVTVAKERVRLQKWFVLCLRILMVVHAIAIPASFINLIWSF
jgi:hypothetical protein